MNFKKTNKKLPNDFTCQSGIAEYGAVAGAQKSKNFRTFLVAQVKKKTFSQLIIIPRGMGDPLYPVLPTTKKNGKNLCKDLHYLTCSWVVGTGYY